MRKFMIIFICALLALLAVLAFAGNYFFNYALINKRDGPESASDNWLDGHARDVFTESGDGLRLHAHRVDQDGHLYAVVAHGYGADGRGMASFGKRFYERGFSVLLPDLRGHGESEGGYIGMGWHDRLDIIAWVEAITADDPEAEILLFGISMGGATVMMAAGEPLPPNVKLIIEDCGYTSALDEFSVQLARMYGLPAFPVMQATSVITKLRAGFWLEEADAVKQVAKSRIPILFIHGEEDTFVPFRMLDTLYEAATCEKERFTVPGAGHAMAAATDPTGYWAAVDAFIARYIVK